MDEARYRVGSELGHGGLGKVVEAWDTTLQREVALKVILESMPDELRDRFVREAQLAARLEHPNIIPVYDLTNVPGSRHGSQLALTMKRVRGRDLGKVIAELAAGDPKALQRYSRPRLLSLFQDICLGVAFAHSKGILHRDLKPSNVMVGEYGEVLIVDWGLAKELAHAAGGTAGNPASLPVSSSAVTIVPGRHESSSAVTMEGEIVGTPAYMSPEQSEGRMAELDERCDTYALGAILYELLSLRPAFAEATAAEVIVKVRRGVTEAPRGLAEILPEAIPSGEIPSTHGPVPPELAAICLKAMALRAQDRHKTVLELHHDIQLFLEGVKERERKAAEAAERLAEGLRWKSRRAEVDLEIIAQSRRIEKLSTSTETWWPVEKKRPLWDAEAGLRRLEEEKVELEAMALAAFGQALASDPGCEKASDGKCELLMQRFLEAESERDRKGMLLARRTLAQHDRLGKFAARLEAPGVLSLHAHAFECECLRPVSTPNWHVEFGENADQAWEDGGPTLQRPLLDTDRAVPWIRTNPRHAAFGHGSDCVNREVRGVPVFIARYELKDKRLVPGEERFLGETPIEGASLPIGSYRCVLRPLGRPAVTVPVSIDRAGEWKQDVHLPAAADVPPGFRFVPGGPFKFGGEFAGGYTAETLIGRDFFLAEFPTTCAEYLEFLQSLSGEEAFARCPREGDKRYWIQDQSGIRIPRPGEDARFSWDPRWPVLGVSWLDALAYGSWRSRRLGRLYMLAHEEQIEKAIRGVDARVYAFGDEHDPAFAHCNASLSMKLTPLPIGSFPADESPYGIRDLTGGMGTWCLNSAPAPYREWRAIRGGAWSNVGTAGRAGARIGNPPTRTAWSLGIRLCVNALRWPRPTDASDRAEKP